MDENEELQAAAPEEPQEGSEPQGDGTDYKALYEQAKANARKWEKLAKKSKPSDAERIAELEAQVAGLTVTGTRAEVAAAKGVPVALVTGSTREEMEASADALLEWKGKADPYPQTRDAGEVGGSKPKKTAAERFGDAFDRALSR